MCPVRYRHTLPTCRVNVAWGVPLYDGAQAQAPAAQVCQLFLSLGHLLVVLHLSPHLRSGESQCHRQLQVRSPLCGGLISTMESGDVLGHEFMGKVMEAGWGGQQAQARRPCRGPTISCGSCFFCQRGRKAMGHSPAVGVGAFDRRVRTLEMASA